MALENDFLPFAAASGANVLTQSAYVALASTIVANGFGSGIAPSIQLNKVWRQSSIIAAMLAQFISDNAGVTAIDDGTTATLEANLLAAVKAIANGQIAAAGIPSASGLTTTIEAWVTAQNYTTLAAAAANIEAWVSAGFAPINNAGLTGNVNMSGTAVIPGPPAADSSTRVPNTNWVQNLIASFGYTTLAAAAANIEAWVSANYAPLSSFAFFQASNSGYLKLPNGCIMQWGTGGVGTATKLTFPIAFPTNVVIVASFDTGPSAGSMSSILVNSQTYSLTQVNSWAFTTSTGAATSSNMGYIAIGY